MNWAQEAEEKTKEGIAKEKVQLVLGDYTSEKYTTEKTLEEYLNEQKEKGNLDEVTTNEDETITVEVEGYEITIKEDFSIIKAEKKNSVKVTMPEIEEAEAFSRAIGVIDIIWLNENNTVRTESQGPLSPAKHLGGLTPIKYSGTTEVEVTDPINDTSWYDYVAQTGTNDGKTSNWANARSSDKNAYFVWIPRYAYKITYFDTITNANAYRADNTSKTGIIGYSNIHGMVDVSTETEKLVKGTRPINVTGKVRDSQYVDYIPHPAFEFGGSKAGIWAGKFESSGTTSAVKIKPNVVSLRDITLSDMFTACQGVKTTYGLTGDSHMMKNTEWGAVAYLAESKYGRNGVEVTINDNRSLYTGGGNYTSNKLQSTTGNIYGIYDMSGGSWEYIVAYVNKNDVISYYEEYLKDFINAVKKNRKYADIYPVLPGETTNYSYSKVIKGDAVFETSQGGVGATAWHGDRTIFDTILARGGSRDDGKESGIFCFSTNTGQPWYYLTFRVAYVP